MVCFLCRAREQVTFASLQDFSGFFELIVLEYVKWIFLLTQVSLYTELKNGNCCWLKVFSIFLACIQKRIPTKGGQARTQLRFQFSHFSYH